MSAFNDNHPELQQGEVFVANTANPEMGSVQWKTKRLGKNAYDFTGKPLNGLYPVFRQENEATTLLDVLKLGARITFEDSSSIIGVPNKEIIIFGTENSFSDKEKLTHNGVKAAMVVLEKMREELASIK